MTTAYPLAWPQGFPRTKSRNASRFKTTVHQAVNNVTDELRRFGNDTGKVVAAFGTVNIDDCYPGFLSSFDPSALALNQDHF